MRTIGLSPKAVLAFLYPTIATVAYTTGSWIATGDFNASEVRVALAGLVAAAVAALGAYVAEPGNVRPEGADHIGDTIDDGDPAHEERDLHDGGLS